jgi:predicted amidohydrolase
MRDTAKITLVQLEDHNDGKAIDRMPAYFDEAAEQGSDLIVFPEYILGQRIPISHESVVRFCSLTAQHKMYAIVGLVEEHEGGRWSTTAIVVDRQGEILGRYYKTHPAAGPGPHWWPPIPGNDAEARGLLGNRFDVFKLDFGSISILECYDGYFPEAWGCASYAGAEIILWINGRMGMIEDAYCRMPAECYACVVGANITNGRNTGFAGPAYGDVIKAEGEREEARLFPRIKEPGDASVTATIDLAQLRWVRKHHRQSHQRRPDLYGPLTQPSKIWQDYPDIPWDDPSYDKYTNIAQLPPEE